MSLNYDPNVAISSEFGIFGIPVSEAEARVVLLPVPWEVTTSYGVGAAHGPRIIREASEQVDLFDLETGTAYQAGYFMREIPEALLEKNVLNKALAQELIALKTNMSDDLELQQNILNKVNKACREMTDWVYGQTQEILKSGKLFGLVGGDHSTPWGAIRAVSEKYKGDIGILHIDAHADLRNAYQGFEQSHASIMYNVMMNGPTPEQTPKKLVQVGIRDFCEEEYDITQNSDGRIKTFFDLQLKKRLLAGESWKQICAEIISELPQNVYISFDIDGLDPALCPNTGTPVPGGLGLDHVFFLFHEIHNSGRKIVAFDLNEVSPGAQESSEWDGNVGARVLYKLCGWLTLSHK